MKPSRPSDEKLIASSIGHDRRLVNRVYAVDRVG